jgi:predicted amidohydrolase
MRVGVVQLTSTDDLDSNLTATEHWVRQAVDRGAELVALPEMFAYLRREGSGFPHAQGVDGEIIARVRGLARELGVRIVAGSFAEEIPEQTRVHNTSVSISPEGEVDGVYRKIHLFDVDLGSAGGGAYAESASVAPGEELVVVPTPFGGIGLSICYDLRFPELYRALAAQGARFVTVPSAFTPHTGKDHWEVLLRARAIENQVFAIAPAQCGRHSPDRASYGRSLIVDPWGVVLAQLGDQPGVAVAECALDELEHVRESLPALRHRRL